jgi:methylphosphotriester-DNA--protein-cysteine methyltransferase
MKGHKLIDASDTMYVSSRPGTFGGHRATRIYGRLDCPSALRAIDKGGYVRHRVFFADEPTAVAAGYRPCARCLPDRYREWRMDTVSIASTGDNLAVPPLVG